MIAMPSASRVTTVSDVPRWLSRLAAEADALRESQADARERQADLKARRQPPEQATLTLPGTEARVEVYRARYLSKRTLYHPDDLRWERVDGVGQGAVHLNNGAAVRTGLALAVADDEEPEPWDVPWLTWAEFRQRESCPS